MIRIVLAGEPRGKGRPRFLREGFKMADGRIRYAFPDKETASYEGRLKWAAQIEMAGAAPLTEPLCVLVTAWVSIPASTSKRDRARIASGEKRPTVKPDGDNIAKMLDALNKIAWRDDAQIVDLRVVKQYDEKPRLEIEIRTLTEMF